MYFPKSQITTNLYTNGGEFILLTTKTNYIGYYYKTSTNKYYTGKNPDDKPNVELLENETTESNISDSSIEVLSSLNSNVDVTGINNLITYSTIKNVGSIKKIIPYYISVFPTNQDYQNEEFQRYFCKKTNEIIYIEINQEQYKQLVAKDPQIEFSLYEPFTVTWKLVGEKQEVARINKNTVELLMFRHKFTKFNLYLKEDYTKYYQ
jgi:hypothetical protein